MKIDFVFDTVCPWCFIGKRRLERALARRPLLQATITWRAFMLNPDMPPGGMPAMTFFERKFGSLARIARMTAGIVQSGCDDGIAFDFDRIKTLPNTLHSHRLIRWVNGTAPQHTSQVVDALFSAYFEQGRDIGDKAELLTVARDCGLDEAEAARVLISHEGQADILAENQQTHRMSINGIPSIVLADQWGLAGAQEPDILVRLIDMATESQPDEPVSRPRMSG